MLESHSRAIHPPIHPSIWTSLKSISTEAAAATTELTRVLTSNLVTRYNLSATHSEVDSE